MWAACTEGVFIVWCCGGGNRLRGKGPTSAMWLSEKLRSKARMGGMCCQTLCVCVYKARGEGSYYQLSHKLCAVPPPAWPVISCYGDKQVTTPPLPVGTCMHATTYAHVKLLFLPGKTVPLSTGWKLTGGWKMRKRGKLLLLFDILWFTFRQRSTAHEEIDSSLTPAWEEWGWCQQRLSLA